MRVTHVITRLIVGGAQENTLASVFGLRRKPGLEVDLVSGPTLGPEGSLAHLCQDRPGVLTIVPRLVRRISPWDDLLALRCLSKLFLASRPDIVHTHSGKAGVLGRLAAARAGVPVTIHTIHGPSFGNFQGPLANAILTNAERRAARLTTHFVVVCDAMKEQYLAAGIGRPDQYTKILSGFDLDPFLATRNDPQLRASLGFSPEDIIIGKVARLFKLKGHDDLFAVASRLVRAVPRIKFLLVGDGPWRGRFEQRAGALGLADRFVFAGLVPPDRVPPLIGIMDVLVHLSTREGLARALPQALAAGRPVVAYACDGAPEVCHDGETGFLVPPRDLEGVESRLAQLSLDSELRTRLGSRGREFVRDRFGVARMVEELYELYRAIGSQRAAAYPPLSAQRMAC